MKHLIFLAAALLPISVVADEFYKGENLITPYEIDPEQWETLTKVEGSFRSMLFKSRGKGMADAYVINIQGGKKSKLTEERERQDAPGKKKCLSFETIDLDSISNQNYDSLIWRTECTAQDDSKVQMLQLLIKGKDSTYHLQKIWRGLVADDERNSWIEMFNKVYVCDTRVASKTCPKDYKKVKN